MRRALGRSMKVEIHIPVVRANQIWMLMAMEVYVSDGGELQQTGHPLLGFVSAFFPERLQLVPHFCKPDLIGIDILKDQPFQHIGIASNNSETDRSSIVLHKQSEAIKAFLFQELFRDFSEPIKRVGEVRRIRHVAIAETGIIRRNDMKAAAKSWH